MACSTGDTPRENPAQGKPVMTLAGSEWNMGDGSAAFVAFKSDGSVIGSGSCNNFRGTYSQDGKAVRIGPLATTRKMCPPEVMKTEMKLLGVLDEARFVEASHLKMTLMNKDRQILWQFKRSDWD